jgi:hypothetical protein
MPTGRGGTDVATNELTTLASAIERQATADGAYDTEFLPVQEINTLVVLLTLDDDDVFKDDKDEEKEN